MSPSDTKSAKNPPSATNPATKAIFLDRDGVISDNSKHYYLTLVEEFRLNPGVIEALSEFKERGYIIIVITKGNGCSIYPHIGHTCAVANIFKTYLWTCLYTPPCA